MIGQQEGKGIESFTSFVVMKDKITVLPVIPTTVYCLNDIY